MLKTIWNQSTPIIKDTTGIGSISNFYWDRLFDKNY